MRCSQVQNLLPEYVEGALAATQQGALAAHLHACPTCAAEERSYQSAFEALNSRRSDGTPDLWAAFSARLANELTCVEARELIPLQADPAMLGARAEDLRSHLAACSPCASEAVSMVRAIAAIESVPLQLPEVDLWPAFAARTANAPARTSWLGSIRRALSPIRNPLAGPILAMAAIATLLFGSQWVLNFSPPAQEVGLPVATVSKPISPLVPSQPPPIGRRPVKPVAVAKARVTPLQSTRALRRKARAVAVVVAVPHLKPPSAVSTVARLTQSVRPRQQTVAFDPGITPTADATLVSLPSLTDSNTERAQQKVMPEVVQAVALLLDFGDSTSHPFGDTP